MNEEKFEKDLQQDLQRMNAQAQQPGQPQMQQPVQQYAQQPVQPQQYAQPQPQYAQQTPQAEPKQNTKPALIMCLLSLFLNVGMSGVSSFITYFGGVLEPEATTEFISPAMSVVVCLSYVASIVLMIIVRVRYRKYTFGKVLMWVYIVEAILFILAIVLVILFFMELARQCHGL